MEEAKEKKVLIDVVIKATDALKNLAKLKIQIDEGIDIPFAVCFRVRQFPVFQM